MYVCVNSNGGISSFLVYMTTSSLLKDDALLRFNTLETCV